MPRILYLAHNLDDSAVWRRVEMLTVGGAEIDVAGFRRDSSPLPRPAVELGMTENSRLIKRAFSVVSQRVQPNPDLAHLPRPDIILARSLEMLALAGPVAKKFGSPGAIRVVYEVLDIHRLMVGDRQVSRILRGIERHLCRRVDHLIVSSPAFVENYFTPYGQCDAPVTLVENKVHLRAPELHAAPPADLSSDEKFRIGWFGILRCKVSLDLLDQLTRAAPHVKVVMRGRPALDEIPNFHSVVESNPNLAFGGPYAYPDDLSEIYGSVDLAWLVDRYEAGANSEWLLPNRLYESGLNGVPPIGLAGTEIERQLSSLDIGVVLKEATLEAAKALVRDLSPQKIAELRRRQRALPLHTWMTDKHECRRLVAELAGETQTPTAPRMHPEDRALIIIPTLNEAAHVGQVIDRLAPSMTRLKDQGAPPLLVVADGGSSDATREIVRGRVGAMPDHEIHLLDNPKRLQSSAVNLAARVFGDGMTWLVRVDAHAHYPDDYVETLIDEANITGAASVVVSMHAVGDTPLQKAIADTQNSPIGNGGSAHRNAGRGRFVDHGHHALMRLDAFRAVGGYDESFSHNEDAELDLRLAEAGFPIWLTSRTRLDYVPRRSVGALMKQYYRFGRGRARTTLKHRLRPQLRQLAMIGVVPVLALSILSPFSMVFAVPALVWLLSCIAGGAALAIWRRDLRRLAGGPIAAAMHAAWSAGFWRQLLAGAPSEVQPRGALDQPVVIPEGRVGVGLCTFRRPMVIDTLETLEAQTLPAGVVMTILVADNDQTPSAKSLVEGFAARSRHEVVYHHAPAGNISIARNAVLDLAETRGLTRLAFIDDDERAPPHWLAALLETMARSDAEVTVGAVSAIYSDDAPGWMKRRRIHDTRPEIGSDGRPIAGHSCNVLMDIGSPTLSGLRFELDRGVSGGEDTAFFEAARRAGARLALAPDATLHETVPPSRARLPWLLKRRYRMGQTHGSLLLGTGGARAGHLGRAVAKVAFCGLAAMITSPVAEKRNANLVRGALHAGTVSALLGGRPVTIYGDPKAPLEERSTSG